MKKYFINPLRQTVQHIEFYQDSAKEHRWRVVAANNEIVGASSEGFHSEQGAVNNARLTSQLIMRILTANELY